MADGASLNERLLAAAKSDNEELMREVLEEDEALEKKKLDINYKDGLGNTALHYAAKSASVDVLEIILEQEGCDVDPQNRLDHSTPLHMAVRLEDQLLRTYVVRALIESGADVKIPDKHGVKPKELVPADDKETLAVFKEAEKELSISKADIADDDDDEDGDPASDSDA